MWRRFACASLVKLLLSSFAKATEDKSGVRMCKYYKEYASRLDWLFCSCTVVRIRRYGDISFELLSRLSQLAAVCSPEPCFFVLNSPFGELGEWENAIKQPKFSVLPFAGTPRLCSKSIDFSLFKWRKNKSPTIFLWIKNKNTRTRPNPIKTWLTYLTEKCFYVILLRDVCLISIP